MTQFFLTFLKEKWTMDKKQANPEVNCTQIFEDWVMNSPIQI